MPFKINWGRIRELSNTIRGLEDLIDLLEYEDPQYKAVSRIVGVKGCRIAAVSIIANALISYQLSVRGEVYWSRFADTVSGWGGDGLRGLYHIHRGFLENTPYNRMGLNAKIRRLETFYNSVLARELYLEPLRYCSDLGLLVDKLSRLYSSSRESKTLVFAGKMYYYMCRICDAGDIGGSIAIPVDRRIAYITLTSCLIRSNCIDLKKCSYELMKPRYRGLVIEAWNMVSKYTGIPTYRLDSLLWLLGRFISRGSPYRIVDEIVKNYKSLEKFRGKLLSLIIEFTKCLE